MAASLAACGSNVVADGGGGEGGGEGAAPPCGVAGCGECPGAEPVIGATCDATDGAECQYGAGLDCYHIVSCEPVYPEAGAPSVWVDGGLTGTGCVECFAGPTCNEGDVEVSVCPEGVDCYVVEACGDSVTCMSGTECNGVPVCDPGDTEVPDCPDGSSCYYLTLCDTTIACMDSALPQHGCPDAPPEAGADCDAEATCYWDTSAFCSEGYQCDGFTWTFLGQVCE